MTDYPFEKWCTAIHERLTANDPTASAELAETFLPLLVTHLKLQFPMPTPIELLNDAAEDALINYIRNPASFDPSKRGLKGFLEMSARGDVLNALAKSQRRRNRETGLDAVEETSEPGNELVDPKLEGFEPLVLEEIGLTVEQLRTEVAGVLQEPTDRAFLNLILRGERSTAAFAQVIGLQDRPFPEQAKAVKRHKDRIMKRLRRLGDQLRGRNE